MIKILKIFYKIFTIIIFIFVSALVIIAIYSNKEKFYDNNKPVKYKLVIVDKNKDINNIISSYIKEDNKDKIISEIKRINNIKDLNSDCENKKEVFIPILNQN